MFASNGMCEMTGWDMSGDTEESLCTLKRSVPKSLGTFGRVTGGAPRSELTVGAETSKHRESCEVLWEQWRHPLAPPLKSPRTLCTVVPRTAPFSLLGKPADPSAVGEM